MANFYSQYPAASGGGSNPSIGTNGAVAPGSSTEVAGINPSGNLQPLQTDATGALITTPATGSVQHVIVDSSALPTGASTSALQISGNTQLVTIASNQTNGTQVTAVNSSALPTGAATAANQTTQITAEQATQASAASIDTKTPALGQALAAASVPVVLTAAQLATLTPLSTVAVSGSVVVSNFPSTQPVSGTVSVSNFPATQPVSATALPLPAGASTSALQSTISGQLPASLGAKVTASSLAVNIASDQVVPVSGTLTTTAGTSTTGTQTSVAGATSSTTLHVANTSRKGLTVFNDSTSVLFLCLGATASTTAYTVQILSLGYYELPFTQVYTGIITGIWTTATGNARITELT